MLALIATRDARLDRSYQLLHAFSYQSVLERGFALVRDGAGHPLRSAAAVQPGMPLDIEFADGCVGATAQSVRNVGEARSPPRRPSPRPEAAQAENAARRPLRPRQPVRLNTARC